MRRDDTREGRIIMKHAKRRQRLRGTCKWGGVTLCALLFALWLASGWYLFGLFYYFRPAAGIVARKGTILIGVWPEFPVFDRHLYVENMARYGSQPAWFWREFGASTSVSFPLWLPLLLIALPTGFLFWSDHRKRTRMGHCTTCGYDLKGNTSGTCPECGAVSSAGGNATSAL